jgi:3-phenylpropionate/trans-cinnamate dioxygenase ferredoxin component
MENYVEVAGLERPPPGGKCHVRVAGRSIALFNVEGTVYAIDDSCAHAGASLAAGRLEECWVTCPAHGMRFDVRTGRSKASAGFGVASYAVKVEAGKILLAVDGCA